MKAPDFNLPDQDGVVHKLAEYAGQWLVLYFYPKDDTPGCTAEACSFRDAREVIVGQGAVVVGISKDSVESHKKFANKHELPFTLLSDPEGQVIEAYGAWGKKMFGIEGILRKTFIINPSGEIVKTYGRVTPNEHAVQIIKDLQGLKAAV